MSEYLNTVLCDVELLSRKGGGNAYTYRYNLHYSPPDPGEIVVVPFGKTLSAAIILSAAKTAFAGIGDGIRPVLGVCRSPWIARISEAARKIMSSYLRPAEAAFSFFFPGNIEKETGVFFFAPLRTAAKVITFGHSFTGAVLHPGR